MFFLFFNFGLTFFFDFLTCFQELLKHLSNLFSLAKYGGILSSYKAILFICSSCSHAFWAFLKKNREADDVSLALGCTKTFMWWTIFVSSGLNNVSDFLLCRPQCHLRALIHHLWAPPLLTQHSSHYPTNGGWCQV